MSYRTLIACLAGMAIHAPGLAQNRIGTGKAQELYQQFCAACHGSDLTGGQGSSLVDGIWKEGATDEAIANVIRKGVPGTAMIGYGQALSEEQIRSLVIFIREQNQLAERASGEKRPEPQDGIFQSEEHAFRLERIGEGDGILWALEFLPDGSILSTQRDGTLWRFANGQRYEVSGIPEVWQQGQGGLLEVQRHPDYEENGWIYLGYSESVGVQEDGRKAGMTAIVRGRIKDNQWVDQEEIFRVPQSFHSSSGVHFGTRFVFRDGYLFFAIGDRGRQQLAQDLARPEGKIHRIHDDGRVPDDNPFVATTGAYPSIWSYGHRNPQGLDLHPATGELWEVEHGPRGGDEVNLILEGRNYGWPVITYGMNYDGTPITEKTRQEGMEQPKRYWVPSIAICGIDFYSGDRFPRWQGDLFVSGMASEELHRLVIKDQQVVHDEIVFEGQGRIRDIHSGPDGYLYVLLNTGSPIKGSIHRLVPAESAGD